MGVVYTPSSSGVSERGRPLRTYARGQTVSRRRSENDGHFFSSLLGREAGTPDGHVKWPLALRPSVQTRIINPAPRGTIILPLSWDGRKNNLGFWLKTSKLHGSIFHIIVGLDPLCL